MQVKFNDVPGGVATLKTQYTGCSNTAANGQSPLLTVYIRSITNWPMGQLTLNGSTSGNIEFGSSSPVTLTVPLLAIPRNSNDPNKNLQIFAQAYEWTIPAGWLWPGGAVSTGAPRLFNDPRAANNTITVTPPGNTCGGGAMQVKVKAVDTECLSGAQPGFVPTRSVDAQLNIHCVLPTLQIASNGAPDVIRCGDVRDYGFRVVTQGGHPTGTFTYSWSAPGWSLANSTAQLPGIRPSGNNGTIITLTGTYTRSGITAQLAPASLSIGYNNQTAAPVLNGPNGFLLCYGESFQVTPSGNPGNQYYWDVDAATNVSISPNPSVEGQPVTITALSSGLYPFEGAVTVQVRAKLSA
jgi:hypothetical protein